MRSSPPVISSIPERRAALLVQAGASECSEGSSLAFQAGTSCLVGRSSSVPPSSARPVNDATALLKAIGEGEQDSAEKLLNLLYEELRRLAASKMAREAPGQTLQPTELVHEAWLRLIGAENPQFENRAHFFSAAAEAMRRILIDRARRKLTMRHGGDFERIELEGLDLAAPGADQELLAVHEVLDNFAKEYPVQAEVVKLRYFAGMTNEETAQVLGIGITTVKSYWTFARMWLLHAIEHS
jgi:RNA polymerase sigma factor (TIGR02999 family)